MDDTEKEIFDTLLREEGETYDIRDYVEYEGRMFTITYALCADTYTPNAQEAVH